MRPGTLGGVSARRIIILTACLAIASTVGLAWFSALVAPGMKRFVTNLAVLPRDYAKRKAPLASNPATNRVGEWFHLNHAALGLRETFIETDLGIGFTRRDLSQAATDMERISGSGIVGPGLFWAAPKWWVGKLPDDTATYRRWGLVETGWPWRCFWAITWTKEDGVGGRRGALEIPPWRIWAEVKAGTELGVGVVPAFPNWPLLVADLAVHGCFWGFWLSIVPAWKALQRRRWRRSGHCVLCGYDLQSGGLAECPECGGTLTPASPPAPAT